MMKWIVTTLAALAVIGCATQPPAEKQERPVEEAPAVAEDEEQAEKPSEQASEEKTATVITETVYLLAREDTFSPDGFLEASLEISYEEEGTRRLEERMFGLDGEPEETKIFEYEGDKLARISTYDKYGDLLTVRVHEYGPDGQLRSDSLFTADNKLQLESLYEYDRQGRKVTWIVRNGDGVEQARTEYSYGQHPLPAMIEMFSPSGEPEGAIEYDFDGQGRIVKETYLDADGRTVKYIDYIYSGPGVQEERHFRGKGTPVRRVVNTFDEYGNIIEVRYAGPAGALQAVAKRVYTSREVKRTISEE